MVFDFEYQVVRLQANHKKIHSQIDKNVSWAKIYAYVYV